MDQRTIDSAQRLSFAAISMLNRGDYVAAQILFNTGELIENRNVKKICVERDPKTDQFTITCELFGQE